MPPYYKTSKSFRGEQMEIFMLNAIVIFLLVLLSIEGLLRKVHKSNTEILKELRELNKE
ncbi:hypothetical protein GA0061094_0577 [[Bacillus] enclensis]|uniref:Uncharacterized protein n=2 Tax=Rossellomorea TaxID=2837508 RepID=A0A1C3ZCJ8_9BACI|nr:hypothetical protein GA0061094_0577 [[Bacillus] enclensis]